MSASETPAHTPGPWVLERGAKAIMVHAGRVPTVPQQPVAWVYLNQRIGGLSDGVSDEEARANARRIVAAVNACEGLSTAALEAGAIGSLLEAVQTAIGLIDYAGDAGIGFRNDDWQRELNECLAALTAARDKAKGFLP